VVSVARTLRSVKGTEECAVVSAKAGTMARSSLDGQPAFVASPNFGRLWGLLRSRPSSALFSWKSMVYCAAQRDVRITQPEKGSGPMSKKHNGKKLCSLITPQREYEVRGRHVFRTRASARPIYEICGNYIYEYMMAAQPVFRIRGDGLVYRLKDPSKPVFEFR
jgi:hypothetical protein